MQLDFRMKAWFKKLFHIHEWQKVNSWSYQDYRCKHCGKAAYARDIGKPVTEWNQK